MSKKTSESILGTLLGIVLVLLGLWLIVTHKLPLNWNFYDISEIIGERIRWNIPDMSFYIILLILIFVPILLGVGIVKILEVASEKNQQYLAPLAIAYLILTFAIWAFIVPIFVILRLTSLTNTIEALDLAAGWFVLKIAYPLFFILLTLLLEILIYFITRNVRSNEPTVGAGCLIVFLIMMSITNLPIIYVGLNLLGLNYGTCLSWFGLDQLLQKIVFGVNGQSLYVIPLTEQLTNSQCIASIWFNPFLDSSIRASVAYYHFTEFFLRLGFGAKIAKFFAALVPLLSFIADVLGIIAFIESRRKTSIKNR